MVAGIGSGFSAARQIDPEPLAILQGFAMMGALNLPPEGLGMGPVPCRAFSLSIVSTCQPHRQGTGIRPWAASCKPTFAVRRWRSL